jgi:hypothetical protein
MQTVTRCSTSESPTTWNAAQVSIRSGFGSAFARQYNAHELIYFEAHPNPKSEIAREKQLKSWSLAKKEALIALSNPEWRDLIEEMHAVRRLGDSR